MAENDPSKDRPSGPRYHHGDLRAALLRAGEAELADKGYSGFTLRGTAKRAGVSHAAPAYHFRDADALLSALAARGFGRLSAAMTDARAAAPPDPTAQLIAAGLGYFRFGTANPAVLQLMFGSEQPVDPEPDWHAAGAESFAILVELVTARTGQPALEHAAGRETVALAWSIVHGFTTLATANQLGFLAPPGDAGLEDRLRAILRAVFPTSD